MTFDPYKDIDQTIDSIEKTFHLVSTGMDPSEQRLSTGLLSLDLVLGGGLVGGGWYTFFGPEQSGKSTAAIKLMTSALNTNVPILSYWDYEGSVDAGYLENILKTSGIKTDVTNIFGVRDEKGNWVVRPRVRYYSETLAEKFFDYLAKLQRSLPDKIKIGDNWYFVYENNKQNKAIVGNEYDKEYYKRTGKFRISAEDGSMQAFIITDSYPAMLPEGVDEDNPSGSMAQQARMFSEQLRRVKGRLRNKRICVVGVNQLRQRPAMMFGDPNYEPGGESLKFYCFGENTCLWTDQGMTYPSEVQNLNSLPARVLGEQYEKPNEFASFEKRPVIDLTLKHGFYLRAKPDHAVLTKEGFKKLKDLSAKDSVAILSYSEFSSNKSIQDLPYAKIKLLVFISLYGSLKNDRLVFESNVFECELKYLVISFFSKVHFEKNEQNFLEVFGNDIIDWIKNEFVFDLQKDIPKSIRQGNRAIVQQYVSSLLSITLLMPSTEFARKLQVLLLSLQELYSIEYDNKTGIYLKFIKTIQQKEYLPVLSVSDNEELEKVYDFSMPSKKVLTNGIVSHNSDVRLKLTPRAVSAVYKGTKGQVLEEPSVTSNNMDTYRFIHCRAFKNKLSTPYLETMLRVWVRDGTGKARGFDPVWDVYSYLTMTGQISGTKNRLKLNIGPFKETPLKWDQLKGLILLRGPSLKKFCEKHKLKPYNVKTLCEKQMGSDLGMSLFLTNKKNEQKETETQES